MNCSEASAMAVAYADGEIDEARADGIREHLATCMNCAATIESLRALRVRIRAEVPVYRASAALRARVLAAATAEVPPRAPRERWRWLVTGALAGCAATVLSWTVGTALLDRRVHENLVAEVVAMHVRATLGNHRVEVASSDQHTVKPWLSARLDYSPPVRDQAIAGFVLVGGRIDYLDGKHVATLVYRYRDHVVDVFVRPLSARTSTGALQSLRGFNVARATGPAMEWIAVSDVNAEALAELVQGLASVQ